MTYTSNLGTVLARLEEARRGGLKAAAAVIVTDLKANRFRGGGYTSRAFSPDLMIGLSIFATEPVVTPSAGEVKIGPDAGENGLRGKVALWWEVGHMNRWTRKYERVERFMPSLRDNAERARDAYARVVARLFGGGG